MYSPLGLVIFVAVEGTFVCFTKAHDHFISNFIRCGFLRRNDGHAGVSLRCCRMLGVVSHYISFLCHLHAINAYSIKDTACMYKRI